MQQINAQQADVVIADLLLYFARRGCELERQNSTADGDTVGSLQPSAASDTLACEPGRNGEHST